MSLQESLDEIRRLLSTPKIAVSCPATPMEIPGITPAGYIDGDCVGTLIELPVPKSGTIQSATFWDLSDQGIQTDLEIFRSKIKEIADNAAWAPSDSDMLGFVTEINFFAFDDHGANRTSEVKNIGKDYSTSEGKFWIKAVVRGTSTIAAGALPRFQIQIRSDDANWQES